MEKFINLHTHTDYSLQDSVVRIELLIKKVKDLKQKSIAITDHSNTSGWYKFEENCKKNDIKPIFGCEFYCNFKYGEKAKERHHLIMLAKNDKGVIEIQKLMYISNLNFYYKPILPYQELILNTPKNVIITSACSLGTVGQYAIKNDFDSALRTALFFKDLFKENYYLELQFHPEYQDQEIVNNTIMQIHEKTEIPLTVSSDIHILEEEHAPLRDVIKASAWNSNFENINTNSPTLKSNAVFNDDKILSLSKETDFDLKLTKKAIKNTSKIANLCNAELLKYEKRIPTFNKYNQLRTLFNKKRQKQLSDF